MSLTNNVRIGLIKDKTLKLRVNHQIPLELVKEILKIDKKTDEKKVRYLMELTNHLLRVKGFYKKYPSVHDECNKKIKEDLRKLDFD